MTPRTRLLRFEPLTVVDLPFEVLENAFWRPQAAKLHGKHKESLAAISNETAKKSYQKLRVAWRREETWINHALNALLASIPDVLLGGLIGELCGGIALDAPHLAKLDAGGIPSITGAPDFVVMGRTTCILGESKVAAHAASQRYDFQQFTKYQMLGAILACARDPAIKRDPAHLIVVPDAEPRSFCADHGQWRPQVHGRRIAVEPDSIDVRDAKGRFRDFATWRTFVRDTLLDKRVLKRCDLDGDKLARLTAVESPILVPTYVVTWADLMGSVRAVSETEGFRNLGHAANKLEGMAYGAAADAMKGDRLDKFVAGKVIFSTSSCETCARRSPQDFPVCEAFPKGIPTEILVAKHDHKTPYPGDGRRQYVAR